MEQMITLSKEKYEKLKKKADLADSALLQVKASLEDLRQGRVIKVSKENSKTS